MANAGYRSADVATSEDGERRIDPHDGIARTLVELMQWYDGVYNKEEVEAYFLDECKPLAAAVTSSVAASPASGCCNIRGLEKWLEERDLEEYVDTVKTWCLQNGAVSLSEVEENFEEIKAMILASEIEPGERVRVRVLKGSWKGQYVAEVLETTSEGIRLRHEEDDFVETLPWSLLGGKKYAMEPVSDDEQEESAAAAAPLQDLLRTGRLRADPDAGAGLELRWVKMGYRVDRVDAHPFQPDLRVGDVIVAVGESLLAGLDEAEVETRFGDNFADGVIFVAGNLDALMRRSTEQVCHDAEQRLSAQ